MIDAVDTSSRNAVSSLQFLMFGSSLLLKVLIFNLSFVVFLLAPDFNTDLFVNQIGTAKFLYCIVVVNLVTYVFYLAFTRRDARPSLPSRVDKRLNVLVVLFVLAGLIGSYFVLSQKTLSLSSSTALLAIASHSHAIAFVALCIFVAGIPESIALDEYIPIVFCALINFYVFLPWLLTRRKYVAYSLCLIPLSLIGSLMAYYVFLRYSPFKLIERIFEQAAPLSWEGDPLVWLDPHAIVEGMPDERVVMAAEGIWDAQFKVTYLVGNAPVLGSVFLLIFAFFLGRFSARTLVDCETQGSNVFKNFLKLKLIVILIEVLGEKVFNLEKIIVYATMIALVDLSERMLRKQEDVRGVL